MSDPKVHNYVKQADGSKMCTWCAADATEGKTGCRLPPSEKETGLSAADLQSAVERGVEKGLQKGQTKAVSISKLSAMTAMKVLKAIGLAAVDEVPAAQIITAEERERHPFVHIPFAWPSNDEEKDTAAAVVHVQSQLNTVGVDSARFKVVDCHKQNHLLDTEIAHIALSGGTDAVVVPKNTSVDWGLPFQLRVAFELKLPAAMASLNAQGIGELLGASDWSDHPVLVVVTDLQATFHLYWVDKEEKKKAAARMVASKNVDPADAWRFVRLWLMDLSSPDPHFTAELAPSRGPSSRINQGYDQFRQALKAAKTPAGTPMVDSEDNPLADQLSCLSMLPSEERFAAAYDIIHSHYPQQLSYFS